MVGWDEEVAELGITGYGDVKRQFVNILDSGDDVEERKRGFWMRNVNWISREVILEVLWV